MSSVMTFLRALIALALVMSGAPQADAALWRFPIKTGLTPIGARFVAANPTSKGVPGSPAEVAAGLADFAVGRIQGVSTTHFLSLAATRNGQIDNVATGPSGSNAIAATGTQTQTFTFNSNYPAGDGFLDGSDSNNGKDSSRNPSNVTMQCMDTPSTYVNGLVKSWDPVGRVMVLSITSAVRGGLGLTGYSASVGTGSCLGSYRLALHLPNIMSDNTSYLGFGSGTGDTVIRDWDWSNLPGQTFKSTFNAFTAANPNARDVWDNNIFEITAPMSGAANAVMFSCQNGCTPIVATNNTFKFTPFKFAPPPVTVTNKPSATQLQFSSLPSNIDTGYVVTDLTNPAYCGGMIITAVDKTNNIITFAWSSGGSYNAQGPQDFNLVNIGDSFQFWRSGQINAIWTGMVQQVSYNYIAASNDIFNVGGSGAIGGPMTVTNNRMVMYGVGPYQHADEVQGYAFPYQQPTYGLLVNQFNWITVQAVPGISNGGNPRDLYQYGGGIGYFPYGAETSFNKLEGGNTLSAGTPPTTAYITSPTYVDANTFQFQVGSGGNYIVQVGDPIIVKGLSAPGLNGFKHVAALTTSGGNYVITLSNASYPGEVNYGGATSVTASVTKTVQASSLPAQINGQPAGPMVINMADTTGVTGGGFNAMVVSSVSGIAGNLSRRILTTAVTPTTVTIDRPTSSNTGTSNGTTVVFSAFMNTVNAGGLATHDNYYVPQLYWGFDGSYLPSTAYYSSLQQSNDDVGPNSAIFNNYTVSGATFAPLSTILTTGNNRVNTINTASWNHVGISSLSASSPAAGTIQLGITDDGSARSDPVTWEYSLDGGPWAALAANFTISGLPAGAHLVKAHSKSAPNYTYPSVMTHTGPDSAAVSVTVN